AEELLGQRLVHGDRAAQITGSRIADPEEIKGSLNLSVFSVGAVKRQEYYIRILAQFQHIGTEKLPASRLDLRQTSVKTSHISRRLIDIIVLHKKLVIDLGNLHTAENIHQDRLMSFFPQRFADHRTGYDGN